MEQVISRIDVHDVGMYEIDSKPIEFSEGMVITCEPGLYLNKGSDAPAKYRGIAIRIEDDVLITQQGPEILTKDVPKERLEIEALMGLELQIGIIGGGPVGSIAGLALKRRGHTVRLFDPTTPKAKDVARTFAKQHCRCLRTSEAPNSRSRSVKILVNEKGLPGSVLLNASIRPPPLWPRDMFA